MERKLKWKDKNRKQTTDRKNFYILEEWRHTVKPNMILTKQKKKKQPTKQGTQKGGGKR